MMRLRTYLQMAFALLLVLSGMISIAVAAPATPAEATWTPIVTLPVGSEEGQIAYQYDVEGAMNRGPQALASGPDGTIYLLDSVQRRVHVVRSGAVQTSIPLPFATYPRDILVTKDGLYILDDDNRILHVSFQGKLLVSYQLPSGLASHQVYHLAARPNGKVVLWTVYYREFELENMPANVDLEFGVWEKNRSGRGVQAPGGLRWLGELDTPDSGRFVSSDGKNAIPIEVKGTFGSARLLSFDRANQLYAVVEDLYDNGQRLGVELTVRRYQASGKLTGVVRLPVEDFAIAPRRSAEVLDDGSLYVMVPAAQGTTIYHVNLGQSYRSRVSVSLAQPIASESFTNPDETRPLTSTTISTSDISLSRRNVYDRAYTMTTTGWTWRDKYNSFTDGHTHWDDSTPTRKPIQLKNLTDGTAVAGIPYTWGGLDSPWSHSDWGTWEAVAPRWTNWSGALSASTTGPKMGNIGTSCTVAGHCSPAGSWYYSAGIDCSGFVAAAAGETANPKYSTSTLQQKGNDWNAIIDPASRRLNVQPMNFFVSNTHTFYYTYGLPDGSGFSTIEATTDGNPQGAKNYVRTWVDIINAFPYYRSWWQWIYGDGPGVAFTSPGYGSACYGLRGQSVWYKFTIGGARTVTLTGISGGDPDLYIYNASYNIIGRSTAGGSTNDSVYISSAGTYYARVYTWSSNGSCVGYNIGW